MAPTQGAVVDAATALAAAAALLQLSALFLVQLLDGRVVIEQVLQSLVGALVVVDQLRVLGLAALQAVGGTGGLAATLRDTRVGRVSDTLRQNHVLHWQEMSEVPG